MFTLGATLAVTPSSLKAKLTMWVLLLRYAIIPVALFYLHVCDCVFVFVPRSPFQFSRSVFFEFRVSLPLLRTSLVYFFYVSAPPAFLFPHYFSRLAFILPQVDEDEILAASTYVDIQVIHDS